MKYLVTTLLFLLATSHASKPFLEEEKTELCGDDICVVQFNAGFNEANKVAWVTELGDCEKTFIDIGTDTKAAGK